MPSLSLVESKLDPVRAKPAAAYLMSLRTTVSRRGQASALNRAAAVLLKVQPASVDRATRSRLWQFVDWTTISAPAVRAIMAKIDGAPATRNKILSALKGVAHMAWEDRSIDTETFQLIKDLKGDLGLRLATGRHVPGAEIERILDACLKDQPPLGLRDAAIIAVLAGTGMRRAEICAVELAGVDLVQASIRVIGKRNKERLCYMAAGALDALRDWLALRGSGPGPLFCAISKKGEIRISRRLNTITVNRLLYKRSIQAGVKDITPHDFRRTFISEALDAGADAITVADMAGHENVETTRRYDRRGDRAKRQAAALVKVPYKRRPSDGRP